jgi:hypothetical protein
MEYGRIPRKKLHGIPEKNPVLHRNYCNAEKVTETCLLWKRRWKHGREHGNMETWKHRDMKTWRHENMET